MSAQRDVHTSDAQSMDDLVEGSRRGQETDLQTEAFVHDLNNILSCIKMAVDVTRRCPGGSQPTEQLDIIASATRRASLLAQQLLESRAETPVVVDFDAVVAVTVGDLRCAAPSEVDVQLIRSQCPLPLVAHATQVDRIVSNLVLNAFESGSPTVTVSTSRDHEHAVLRVEDRGRGIPAAEMSRVFEPYDSTKNRGTGLGLWIVKSLVEELRGTLDVQSRAGRGTAVEVRVPLAD